jgi:carboxyl-terminal processing protease
MDFGEGKMDNAMKFQKVAPLDHDNYNKISDELATLLSERSAQRRKNDPKFQKQDERIRQYQERKARHSIALSEAKFKAEYAPEEDEKEHAEEEKAKKDKRKKKFTEREVWSNDFYNDEVVRIVGDYLTLGSSELAANPVKAAAANE